MNFSSIKYKFAKLRNSIFFLDFTNAIKKEDKVYPPHYVLWDCTRRCNLNCTHCGATKERYDKELSKDEIKEVIKQLADIKVRFFAVTGGEPLLRQDLFEILAYAVNLGIKVEIATNGFLIDENIAKMIKDTNVASIQVSLDGVESTHNKIRGNELSYQKAVNAIKLLREEDIPIVSVATTVTPVNINELNKLKAQIESMQVNKWRIGVTMPIGRAESKELLLSSTQLRQLLEWIKDNRSDRFNITVAENLTFLAEYEQQVRDTPLICPVGFTACCIGVTGYVRGCPEQPDVYKFREGNIRKTSFSEIWKNGFKRYRNREIIETDLKCVKCKNKYNCLGGCWVMRESNSHCIYELLKN